MKGYDSGLIGLAAAARVGARAPVKLARPSRLHTPNVR